MYPRFPPSRACRLSAPTNGGDSVSYCISDLTSLCFSAEAPHYSYKRTYLAVRGILLHRRGNTSNTAAAPILSRARVSKRFCAIRVFYAQNPPPNLYNCAHGATDWGPAAISRVSSARGKRGWQPHVLHYS
jgi:hypothetical protein